MAHFYFGLELPKHSQNKCNTLAWWTSFGPAEWNGPALVAQRGADWIRFTQTRDSPIIEFYLTLKIGCLIYDDAHPK